jgi:hypothetical protein
MNTQAKEKMELSNTEKEQLQEHLSAIAKILHQNTPLDKLKTFEDIEITLRKQIQEEIAPEIAQFFFREVSRIETGRLRKIKTILGEVSITENQAQYFGLKSHSRLSPKMTKNALLVCANESYQRAEEDLKELTGINISHSTLQRLVNQQELELPESKLGVQEAMVDGGKVRLRTEERGKPCEWRDYKAVSLNGIQLGAFFVDNESLIDWVNSQKLLNPLFCLGDGHPGIWNLFKQIGESEQRKEIIDWYHLKENLYKVGGSIKRLKEGEKLLWEGKKVEALQLFSNLKNKEARNFCQYLERHQTRIINYNYYQQEQICPLGSGSIESGIKQIGRRVKISGAQWKSENVNSVLSLRCAYLNGVLSQ